MALPTIEIVLPAAAISAVAGAVATAWFNRKKNGNGNGYGKKIDKILTTVEPLPAAIEVLKTKVENINTRCEATHRAQDGVNQALFQDVKRCEDKVYDHVAAHHGKGV